MKIDTSTWKTFCFTEIFKVCKGFYNKKPEPSGDGTIPFLSATSENNGVTEHYTLGEISSTTRTGDGHNDPLSRKLFPGHAVCVTNNGSVGFAYYQAESFTCSHDVNPLYRLDGEFNEATGLFVASVIMKDRYRWAYGRKWRPERMVFSTIDLPATVDGKPDWQWMESYIDSLHSKPLTTGNAVKPHPFDTCVWKWFKLGGDDGLFDIRKGKRLTSDDQTDGGTPYIGAIDSNNGVSNYIGQNPIHEGNTISLSYNGSVGEAFYQPVPYWATDDVNALYLHGEYGMLTPATGLFVCTVLKHDKYRYSYGRKWTLDNMNDTMVKLPATPEGKPDWQYMENYIKSLPYGDRL